MLETVMKTWHSRLTRNAVVPFVALAAFTVSCREIQESTGPRVEPATVEAARAAGGGNPAVSSVTPDSSLRGVTLDVTVNGSGFNQGSVARFERQGVPAAGITTNKTTFVTPKKLIANITVAAGADTGKYDVGVVLLDGRKGVGIELFEVLYQLVDVGVIGGTWSLATSINDSGQVVGSSCTQDCLGHAFSWTESGGIEDLGTLPGYSRSDAYSINNLGQILGAVVCRVGDAGCSGSYSEAVIWEKVGGQWTVTRLGIPGFGNRFDINNSGQFVLGGKLYSRAGGSVVQEPLPAGIFPVAINDAGIVAASASANDGSGTSNAVIWFRDQSGTERVLQLGNLPGYNIGLAKGIGEVDATGRIRIVGQVAVANSTAGYSPVRWTLEPDGTGGWRVAALEAMSLPSNSQGSDVWGGNTAGEAVGELRSQNRPNAAKWDTNGVIEMLPATTGQASRARAVNNAGLIVGSVWDSARACERAAFWRRQ
jgi:probable HAF family extracellular repeat protein